MKVEIRLIFNEDDDPRDAEKYQSALQLYDVVNEILKTIILPNDSSQDWLKQIKKIFKKHQINTALLDYDFL